MRGFETRYVSVALLVIAAALVTAVPAGAIVNYMLTDLGALPGGTSSYGAAINASGEVTGGGDVAGGYTHAFLYSCVAGKWQMTDLGTMGGGANSYGYAINDNGDVAGTLDIAGDGHHAFLYKNGAFIDLKTLDIVTCLHSNGYGINNSDEVTGYSDGNYRAFLYNGGPLIDLGTLTAEAGTWSYGYDVNNNGVVTGYASTDGFTGYNRAIIATYNSVTNTTTITDIGTVPGFQTSIGRAINDLGDVTGWVDGPQNATHAFLYTPGGPMVDLDPSNEWLYSMGCSINNEGKIVGDIGTDGGEHAFIYNGSGLVDLNTLVLNPGDGTLILATGINDKGQITGTMWNDGSYDAYVLTPVPEPSAVILIIVGGAFSLVTGLLRRRK